MIVEDRQISLSNSSSNVVLNYLRSGTGKPLLFLHGISGSKEIWLPQMDFFANQFETISWNARGYGGTQNVPKRFDFFNFSSDLHELVEQLKINKVNLCGHSMGGRIALDFAERFPELVNSLILVNTFFGYDKQFTTEQRLGFLRKRKKLLEEDGLTLKQFGKKIIPQMLGVNAPYGVEQKILQTITTLDIKNYLNTVESMVMYQRVCELESIEVPTLIFTGEKDTITPKNIAIEMHSRINNSKLVLIEEAGHFVNLEAPELFNQTVLDFLNKLK